MARQFNPETIRILRSTMMDDIQAKETLSKLTAEIMAGDIPGMSEKDRVDIIRVTRSLSEHLLYAEDIDLSVGNVSQIISGLIAIIACSTVSSRGLLCFIHGLAAAFESSKAVLQGKLLLEEIEQIVPGTMPNTPASTNRH